MSSEHKKRILREYSIILAISVIGFIARLYLWTEFSFDTLLYIFFISIVNIIVAWEFFKWLNRTLNRLLPFENGMLTRFGVQIFSGIVFMLMIRMFIYFFAERYLDQPLDRLFQLATYVVYIILSLGINAAFFAAHFIEKWKESIKMTERLEREKTQVQFDNLKNQLNPHFLFNALTSLNSLIFENQQLASDFLQNLSKVYRYVLQHKDKNSVTLQTELDFIKNFVFLVETRFGSAIKIKMDISDVAKERSIVPVTVQILLENAIKHNIVDPDQPLTIEINSIGDYLIISNNFQPRKKVESSNKLGLENLKSLYGFLTERPVQIIQSENSFVVKIPLL